MKVVKGSCGLIVKKLRDVEPGDVVTLDRPLHSKHQADDPFIVNEVCSSYRPERGSTFRNTTIHMQAVTNLRTGSLAYFRKNSPITIVEAELCLSK